ncbi:MAG: hypothetical protein CO093_00870 [Alphaproteobacteria bacterium CG_4_9_14_3_um_filter_47_13]|nr:MAG: hypothetical protein CO093_00870 [Alphaproteobacteria bacterium CG_4_9_14_3_um_filter_47_13]
MTSASRLIRIAVIAVNMQRSMPVMRLLLMPLSKGIAAIILKLFADVMIYQATRLAFKANAS